MKKESDEVEYKIDVCNAEVQVFEYKDCRLAFSEQGIRGGAFYEDTRCIKITSDAYFEMVSTLIYI